MDISKGKFEARSNYDTPAPTKEWGEGGANHAIENWLQTFTCKKLDKVRRSNHVR